jgi:DNA-directed RNA polymerase subunit RPC12/RpoP
MANLAILSDAATCWATVREMRPKDGITCPRCSSRDITKQGRDAAGCTC